MSQGRNKAVYNREKIDDSDPTFALLVVYITRVAIHSQVREPEMEPLS